MFLLISVYVASIRTALVSGASKLFSMDMMPSLRRGNIFVPGENILKITIPKPFTNFSYEDGIITFLPGMPDGLESNGLMNVIFCSTPFNKQIKDEFLRSVRIGRAPETPMYTKENVSHAFALMDRGSFRDMLYDASRIIKVEETFMYILYSRKLSKGKDPKLFEQDMWNRLDEIMKIAPATREDQMNQESAGVL